MAIAVDQANAGEFALDTASSTIAVTTTATVASGAKIFLFITWVASAGAPTLSSVSGGSLTWTIDKQDSSTPRGLAIVSASAPSGLASGTTITATLSGSSTGARSISVSSFTGVGALDTTGAATTFTSTTAWTTASMTVSANDLVFGLAADFSTNHTSTPTAPATELHDFGVAGAFEQTVAYNIPGAGATTIAGTWSAAGTGTTIGAAYLAAVALTPQLSLMGVG